MPKLKVICSQQMHCLSFHLSIRQLLQIEIYKNLYTDYKINISNNTIKYCYKADNYYDFERRLYF